jgi:membrane protease YdiL (CAAX protease family)
MDYKRANRAYLYMILATIAFVIVYSGWIIVTGSDISVIANNAICEMMILIPALIVVLFSGDRLSVVMPIRKIKVSSILFTLLYTVLLYPISMLANAVSMLFVKNRVMELSSSILQLPMWQMLLSIGLFGPFVEEIVFRGVMLHSYQRTGRIIGSITLSSLLFGMMHLNFNQFFYGFFLGIMLSLLVEATGSVLTSFIAHATFNSLEVILMYCSKDLLENAENYLNSSELLSTATLGAIGIYLILAIISTSIAVCVAYKISEIQGRNEFFINIPKCKKQGYKLITVPLILAIVISLAYMLYFEYLSRLGY